MSDQSTTKRKLYWFIFWSKFYRPTRKTFAHSHRISELIFRKYASKFSSIDQILWGLENNQLKIRRKKSLFLFSIITVKSEIKRENFLKLFEQFSVMTKSKFFQWNFSRQFSRLRSKLKVFLKNFMIHNVKKLNFQHFLIRIKNLLLFFW